jgi:membrane protein YqaA with SNARE-associated domain
MAVLTLLGWLDRLKTGLVALGPLGAFLIALLDSFIPIPGGTDLAVIALSAQQPALAPVTVLAAVAGSVIGSTIVYIGARKAGQAALARVKPARRERVENLLGRYDMLALAVSALLPPPFPFKIFNLSAGVFKIQIARVIIAVAIGRFVRFAIEAVLAIQYGEAALDIIKRHGLVVVGVVALLVLTWLAWRAFASRRAATAED